MLRKPRCALLLALALAATAGLGAARAAPAADAAGTATPSGPVVLELFTSEGCSSCPPADLLLTRLAADRDLAERIVPLAFHVDYWNHLGWRDPFSQHAWSVRQESYARALENGRLYTPQLVVAGRDECVGSQEGAVRRKIREALDAGPPPGVVGLEVRPPERGAVTVRVDARVLRAAGDVDLELLVALYERHLRTAVPGGENAGRTLAEDFVVRHLERAFTLPPAAGSRHSGALTVRLPAGRPVTRLGIAALLQDPDSMAILGAASSPIPTAASR